MAKNEVAKTGNELPSVSDEFASEMMKNGTGLENVTTDDLLIPRITILQGLSPQVVPSKPEYDENAKVGQIYDVGMQESFGDELLIIPVHFVKQWLEWAPRSSGKGLIAIHDTNAVIDKCERNERNQPITNEGNLIQETAQFFCLNLTADGRKSFLPMASTQLKKAKRLLTLASSEKITRQDGSEFTPPLFYRSYKMTTVPESNSEGDWIGWKIERGMSVDQFPDWQKTMEEINNFRESIIKGEAKGDIQSMAEEASQASNSGDNGAM